VTLLLSWLAFPLVLLALSLGCGLLVERAIGRRLELPLLLPTGFALIVVVASFTTLADATAELTVPGAVALAVLGYAMRVRCSRVDRWAAAAAAGTFLAFGAPVLASGEATFAGYVVLDDTATFLALLDHTLDHGRDLEGLAPSTHEATLAVNLAHGYPTGALLPLGLGARLAGLDPAWAVQPYLAFLAALLALSLYALAGRLVSRPPLRALVACIAAQPALLYAFALWGGVKELFGAALLALVTALVAESRSVRAAAAPAVAVAAFVAGLSAGGAVWLVPLACAAAITVLRGSRWQAAALVLAALLSLPALLSASEFLREGNRASFRESDELGNLIRPLRELQLLGIWPSGDFRFQPADMRATHALLIVCVGAAVVGVLIAWKRRANGVLLYAAGCGCGSIAIGTVGSPWLAAKALAIASPAVVLLALSGGASLLLARRRVEGVLVVAALTAGVLWSNVLGYRHASLAPRAQLAELERIGERFAGAGPTLMTEYQPYGVRHFLRRLDAEGASELRRRPVTLRNGQLLDKGAYADLDSFDLSELLVYRTLALRRSPLASRPAASYRLAWRGRYYEVWERVAAPRRVLAHLPLGTGSEPVAAAPCGQVLRLAGVARRWGGTIAAASVRAPTVVPLDGRSATVYLRDRGRYHLWLGGSVRARARLVVDGETTRAIAGVIEPEGQFTDLGVLTLAPGRRRITIDHDSGTWRPGSSGNELPVGPLVLTPVEPGAEVIYVTPAEAGSLCGRRLDWVEVVTT
jgi:hypothetical protein